MGAGPIPEDLASAHLLSERDLHLALTSLANPCLLCGIATLKVPFVLPCISPVPQQRSGFCRGVGVREGG